MVCRTRKTWTSDEPLFEGMSILINKLKNENYLLGIATNKSRIALNNGLKKHELTDLFDITLSTEEANPKPHPDMAQIAMKRFNISNKNTIMIGDTISDIGMGVSAKINTIGVSWGYNNVELLKEAGASFIVNNARFIFKDQRNMKNSSNEILIKSYNNMYNLFISNKELKTPNKNKFNFDNKKIPLLIKKEIISQNNFNLEKSIYYKIFSIVRDKINVNKTFFVNNLMKYAETDLICYWEAGPEELYLLQKME